MPLLERGLARLGPSHEGKRGLGATCTSMIIWGLPASQGASYFLKIPCYDETEGTRLIISDLLESRTSKWGLPNASASSKTTQICTAPVEQGQSAVVPSEGAQIWVCLFRKGRSLPRHPHDRPFWNKHTQICTPSLGTTALCPYSNGAVQIRVGLELAETGA